MYKSISLLPYKAGIQNLFLLHSISSSNNRTLEHHSLIQHTCKTHSHTTCTHAHSHTPSPDNSKSLGELGVWEEEGGGTCFCNRGDIDNCKGTELALLSVPRGEDETLDAADPVSAEGSASRGSCKALFSSCSLIQERCRSTRFWRPCSRRARGPSLGSGMEQRVRSGQVRRGVGREKQASVMLVSAKRRRRRKKSTQTQTRTATHTKAGKVSTRWRACCEQDNLSVRPNKIMGQ